MSASKSFRRRFHAKNLKTIYKERIREARATGLDRMRPANLYKTLDEEISNITRKVEDGSYKFTAYKQKLISKGAGQAPRVLSIPTARDRIVLRALCQVLQDVYPDAIPSIPQATIQEVKTALSSGKFNAFVRLDLRNFYGSIVHAQLQKQIKKRIRKKTLLRLVNIAIQTPTIPEGTSSGDAELNLIGIPQGLSISNQLAEITIRHVDNIFNKKADIAYFRYVDDILILVAADQAEAVAIEAMALLKLHDFEPHDPKVPNSKSRIGKFSEPFSFLGYQIDNGKLSVRPESIHKLESALAAVLTNHRYRMTNARTHGERDAIIKLTNWRLNLKITGCIFEGVRRGWVFYFSQIDETTRLRALQYTVVSLLERFGAVSVIRPKSFLKAFYESRRTDKISHRYIPNFDVMDVSEKRDILALFVGDRRASSLSEKRVEQLFNMRIRHAVKELEADLVRLS
ncbi:reverse transcriptase [Alcaligenaceae bacterium]|nr:reverse transcriptase [Alcaligenaceae bacterium]